LRARSAIAVDILPGHQIEVGVGSSGLEVVSDPSGTGSTDVWDKGREVPDDEDANILFIEACRWMSGDEDVKPKFPDPNFAADTLRGVDALRDGGDVPIASWGEGGVCVIPWFDCEIVKKSL